MENNNRPQLPGLPPLPGSLPKPPASGLSSTPKLPSTPGGLSTKPGLNQPSLPSRPAGLPVPEPARTASTAEESKHSAFKRPSSSPAPNQETYTPNSQTYPAAAPSNNVSFEDFENEAPVETDKPARRSNNKSKRTKNTGRKVTVKEQKKSDWGGKRRNVILARVAVFSIIGMLSISGIFNMIPKASNLTAADSQNVLSQVRQNLNVTDFPKARGEGVALSFTKLYLNIDPALKNERYNELKRYVAEDILANIDPHTATEQELAAAGSENAVSYDEEPDLETGTQSATVSGVQQVTDGPYLVKSEMFKGGSAAIFTTMAEINNTRWVYLEVPMYWDNKTDAISVSGSPTFANPINVASVPARENSSSWNNDREIEGIMKDSVAKFMKAWAESDSASITRYLHLKDGKVLSTLAAQSGLGDTVKFVKLNSFAVEGKKKPEEGASAAEMQDFRERDADISVTFLEPSSGIAYTQNYRLVLRYDNSNWFIYDIKNISALLDRDEVIRLQNEETKKNNEESS